MTKLNVMCEAVRFQKSLSDNTFEMLSILQSSSNDALRQSLDHCSWLPQETMTDYKQWLSYSRSASDELKKLIDGCYQQFEQHCSFWGEERVSPADETSAEVPPVKPKAAVTRKVSAAKANVTDRPAGGSKAKPGPTQTEAEGRKASPAKAVRKVRKKPAAKTQNAKNKVAEKDKNLLTDSSPKAVAAEVKREVVEASPIAKKAAPATDKPPVERNADSATPLIAEKKVR